MLNVNNENSSSLRSYDSVSYPDIHLTPNEYIIPEQVIINTNKIEQNINIQDLVIARNQSEIKLISMRNRTQ